jgi:hypothetical protein
MTNIDVITLEAADTAAAEAFYASAFDGVGGRVRVRAGQAETSGFRGYTLSLIVAQPADADSLFATARDAGAEVIKAPTKSMWGYGGSVRAPDGSVWTIASSKKKNSGPASRNVDAFVLQLGVADVAASRRFYVDQGLTVAKSYGSRYVELDTGPVTLALNKRGVVAKNAGVPADGSGSHRLLVGADAGAFTDPDGYAWETVTVSPPRSA